MHGWLETSFYHSFKPDIGVDSGQVLGYDSRGLT